MSKITALFILPNHIAKAAGNRSWIASAPVIIACCAIIEEDRAMLPQDDFGLIVDKTRFGEEFLYYMNSCKDRRMANIFWCNSVPLIPGEHIALAAVNYGLSYCFVGYLDIRKASEILNLPESYACLFLIPIGYAVGTPKAAEKKTIEEIVFYEQYSNKFI